VIVTAHLPAYEAPTVLGLVHHAADLLEHLAQVVRGRGRGRDRIHRADVHSRGDDAEREGGVAVDHDLRLVRALRRDPVAEVEIGLAPGRAGVVQRDVAGDDLGVLLAEDARDLFARQRRVEPVQVAEDAEHEHVLALARVADELLAALLERHLVHLEPVAAQGSDGRLVRRDDARVAVARPHALEQDRRARLELVRLHPTDEHLLVEGDDELGLVAAVAHGRRADADADAAGAGDAARRWLDLGRDDLGRPDAVAHPRGDRAERLAAALRALARVADDLDDRLGDRSPCSPGPDGGRFEGRGVVHDDSGRAAEAQATCTRAKLCSRRGMPKRTLPASPPSPR
jgi:hypothetical protein